MSRVILLLLLLSATHFISAQEPRIKRARTADDYQSRTLKEIFALKPDAADLRDKQERLVVTNDILPSKVQVTYSGATRKLSLTRKEVIRQWARLYAGSMEHYTTPYQTEMRFNENGIDYWLAMPFAKHKFKKGQKVELYLIRLGAGINGEKYDWTLLVENVGGNQ
jgi:hypothetical protein